MTHIIISIALILAPVLVAHFPNNKSNITTDNLGNLYCYENSSIKKFDANGTIIAHYTDENHNEITTIDAQNPFRLLVFSEEANQISFLDNKLHTIGSPLLLDDLEQYSVTSACTSNKGGFWLFDSNSRNAIRYNNTLQVCEQTPRLRTTITTEHASMVEQNGQLYIAIPTSGIYTYDSFGNFDMVIPLKNWQSLQIKETYIFTCKNDSVFIFPTNMSQTIALPDSIVPNQIREEKNRLFVRHKSGISIFNVINR